MQKNNKQPKNKVVKGYKTYVLTRHPSHEILRSGLPRHNFRTLIRLGSQTTPDDKQRVELNSVTAVNTSSDKLLMKQAFTTGGIKTAAWVRLNDRQVVFGLGFPLVIKNRWGSRGTGNYLINSPEEYDRILQGKNPDNYIAERFHEYVREYRLHVTKDGCFYTCRKMLKKDTPEDKRWFRNDSNSTWILEDNPQFDKPSNWNEIVSQSVAALHAVGLDIGAVDVKVQSAKTTKGKDRKAPEFIILETNSAPSFGSITAQKYLEEIPKLLKDKKVVK